MHVCISLLFCVCFSVVDWGLGGLLFAHYGVNIQAHFNFMPTVHI